jgi:hypothetical protein
MVIAGVFVIGSPTADAGITVTGDRQFTDDVNACLNTYRNAPGIVGDTIRELENSENDHSVIESPDWDNTPNDESDAMGGSGTGTVTRVDKAELEDLKKDFPELANKDFCTALLHELWHAADADGGGWSNDTTDGVLDDEIEATTFQNFIHSIRGVAIRTSYGGTDIGHILLAGETSVETSYKHVKPGEYSEVYSTVRTSPGAKVDATLSGPGVSGTAAQSVTADDKGVAKFTWKIVSYGKYTVAGDADGTAFSGTANVQ